MGVSLLPSRWHSLSIALEEGRGISAGTCWLDDVFSADDLASGPYTKFTSKAIEINSF